jgi:diacylglycerol kinase family enzyme
LKILPAGRGDDIFKAICGHTFYRSESAWQSGLELLRRGQARSTDLGRVELTSESGDSIQRLFINVASFGFPGLVVKRVLGQTLGKKKAWTYLYNSLSGMKDYVPLEVSVQVDGREVFQGPIFSGFILNGKYNAGGLCWSDEALVDDGLFHFVALKPVNLFSSLWNAPKYLSGHWQDSGAAVVTSGKLIEVHAQKNEHRSHPLFEIDGDQPEPSGTLSGRFEVLPGALRVWR